VKIQQRVVSGQVPKQACPLGQSAMHVYRRAPSLVAAVLGPPRELTLLLEERS
jgi:hypothetical protein